MIAPDPSVHRELVRNIRIHDKLARKYDAIHGEIFNEVEQARLRDLLRRAIAFASTGTVPLHAMDFGCGSGNLTRHLIELGLRVTAADVSQGFLDLVASRYPAAKTLLMKGGSLEGVPDETFDVVATYSVLHHVPDYLGACRELARICRKGGVLIIDHEAAEEYWKGDATYSAFLAEALRFDWRKYLKPSNYVHRIRRIFDPRHSNEGDIHVWPDDHIEWPKIRTLMEDLGFDTAIEQSYLLNRRLYRPQVFRRYVGRCVDTKAMVFRKRTGMQEHVPAATAS
jgi:ubiquinone/menaquinone biosynthesis C-methylase UbiE